MNVGLGMMAIHKLYQAYFDKKDRLGKGISLELDSFIIYKEREAMIDCCSKKKFCPIPFYIFF